MKTILLFSILFCVIAMPAIGELTVEDLEKIDAKIKESETRIKEYINTKNESIKTPIGWLIGLLIAMIALIGIPLVALTVMIGWRSVKDSSQDKQIDQLRQEIKITHTSETPTH